MENKLLRLFVPIACMVTLSTIAANYATDAMVSLHKEDGELNVDVRVSELLIQDGKPAEHLICAPRIKTSPGIPASLSTGPNDADPDYGKKENVTIDVSWPYPNESGTGLCSVTIKRGNDVVSKSRLQLKVEGPGRMPLVLAAEHVDPNSVRVVDDGKLTCILLEFAGKTREEVKKLAVENYGNKVQLRDSKGRLREGGLSLGIYHETGMALRYGSRNEAEQAAGLLRGQDLK